MREKTMFINCTDEKLLKYYKFVKDNTKQHILYRKQNYHPSPLHKSIRDDDIERFQAILSQNNISVNHKIESSFYERLTNVLDDDMSLIQVAAFYGSIKVFKFLIIHPDIILNDNLLSYGYAGENAEIIHLIEGKCPLSGVYSQPILTHRPDLLEYFIENFASSIQEKNPAVKEGLKKYVPDGENPYEIIDYNGLLSALHSSNFDVIKPCLKKIVFILKNVEENKRSSRSILKCSCMDFELFKFLFFNKELEVDIRLLQGLIYSAANDSFKLLFPIIKYIPFVVNILLVNGILANYDIACFILEQPNIDFLNGADATDFVEQAINFNNEEVLVRIFKLLINQLIDLKRVVKCLLHYLSTKMIVSLMDRLYKVLPKYKMAGFQVQFQEFNSEIIFNHISDLLNKK